MKVTLTIARNLLGFYNMTIRKTDGEYRVAAKTPTGATRGDKAMIERHAYYTDNINDALCSGLMMVIHKSVVGARGCNHAALGIFSDKSNRFWMREWRDRYMKEARAARGTLIAVRMGEQA